MKKLILCFLLCGLWPLSTLAQGSADDINIRQVEPSAARADVAGNYSDADLFDQFNKLTGITNLQHLDLGADARHVARINMNGNSNHADITQTGSGNIGAINIMGMNNTSSLNQTGSDLFSFIHIDGHSNLLDVEQEGTDLGNLVQVLGAGLDINIAQNPAGFHYSQAGAANPITITSTARNVPLIIRNN